MELHKQIKKYRTSYQLSQEELADKIYVTRQTISNWETDKNYPDIHSLLLMSSLFNISLDELIKGDLDKMKEEISTKDIQNFYHQGKILLFLLSITVLSIAPLVYFLKLFGFALWIILTAILLVYSKRIETFKKEHDIQTYKEIIAFTKVERLDEITKQQEVGKRSSQIIVQSIIMGALGFMITYALMKLFFLYF